MPSYLPPFIKRDPQYQTSHRIVIPSLLFLSRLVLFVCDWDRMFDITVDVDRNMKKKSEEKKKKKKDNVT